jgi:hypothetical protein
MSQDTSAHLSRIRQSASTLNKLADQATAQIKALSAWLAADGGLGIEVAGPTIGTGREHNEEHGLWQDVEYRLGYGRCEGGEFDLRVEAGFKYRRGEDEAWETVWTRPLASVSRQLRIAAMAALPGLIQTIAAECEQLVTRTQQSVLAATQAIEQLKSLTQPQVQ